MEMKVHIKRENDNLLFSSTNMQGKSLIVDGGSERQGMRPMELLLSAIGTCSVFDALMILKKQRQEVDAVEVEVTGTRPDEGHVKPFTSAHVHFRLSGNIDRTKAEKALELALYKYCSVSATLRPDTKITHSLELLEPAAQTNR